MFFTILSFHFFNHLSLIIIFSKLGKDYYWIVQIHLNINSILLFLIIPNFNYFLNLIIIYYLYYYYIPIYYSFFIYLYSKNFYKIKIYFNQNFFNFLILKLLLEFYSYFISLNFIVICFHHLFCLLLFDLKYLIIDLNYLYFN